jgi:CMP-N-acetylneuraminic acid synthetase
MASRKKKRKTKKIHQLHKKGRERLFQWIRSRGATGHPKLLAVIPARAGSKRIPGKNVRKLAGIPLLARTIREAKKAKLITRLVVSTEDKKIAALARRYGAEAPFLRPKSLSRDSTPGAAPVLHACRKLPGYQEVLCLQPTSPLRTWRDIDELIRFARKKRANSVVSVTTATKHPAWTFFFRPNFRLRPFLRSPSLQPRQKLAKAYVLNGAIYYAKTNWLRKRRRFQGKDTLGFVMPKERSVDIDDWSDWKAAEQALTK